MKTIGFRGTNHFQTHPYRGLGVVSLLLPTSSPTGRPLRKQFDFHRWPRWEKKNSTPEGRVGTDDYNV